MSYTATINIPQLLGGMPAEPKESEELKRLRYKNPVYEEFCPLWDFYLSAYEGGEAFTKGENIFRHQRENQLDYEDRIKRVHNTNYCDVLVSFFTNFIFSESIDRDGGTNSEWYRDFVVDVDGRGTPLDKFMRDVEDDDQIYGMAYILVDSPPLPTDVPVLSKRQELDLNIRPYWVLIHPDEIYDWVVDKFGKLQYAKRFEIVVEAKPGKPHTQLERYTEYYPSQTIVTDVDVTDPKNPLVGSPATFPNRLGKIPLEVSRYKTSRRYPHIGLSFLIDFANNQREILNLTSLEQEFLYRQCFNMLAKEVDSAVPLAEQEDGNAGTSNTIDVPKGAKMPEYITPPSDPADCLARKIQNIKNDMFSRAAQDAMNELFNGEGKSGFSQAQSFSKTVPFISARADELESVESRLMDLTLRVTGKKWDGKIKYKDRYELTSLMDSLTQFQVLVRDLQITSEEFVKSQLKRFVNEFDGKMPIDQMEKIHSQIDAIVFTEWVKVQQRALVGAPKSPGEQQKPKDSLTMDEKAKEGQVRSTVKLQE